MKRRATRQLFWMFIVGPPLALGLPVASGAYAGLDRWS
jgi:hypothetical protein